ncbi:hypothetical protein ACO2I3_19645 [Leptospira interrogans]
MEGLQPFHPEALLLIAALNPAVILVGFMMGQRADQWQKLIVAAFVAALAGAGLVWLGAWLRILPARGLGGEAGLFVLQMVFGLVWATLGYVFWRKR